MDYHDILRFCGNTFIVNDDNLSSLYSYASSQNDGIFISLLGKDSVFEYFKSKYVTECHKVNIKSNSEKIVYCYETHYKAIKNTDITYFDFTKIVCKSDTQWNNIYLTCFNISDIVILSLSGSQSSHHIEKQLRKIASYCHHNISLILLLYDIPYNQCYWNPSRATNKLLMSISRSVRSVIKTHFSSFLCIHIPYVSSIQKDYFPIDSTTCMHISPLISIPQFKTQLQKEAIEHIHTPHHELLLSSSDDENSINIDEQKPIVEPSSVSLFATQRTVLSPDSSTTTPIILSSPPVSIPSPTSVTYTQQIYSRSSLQNTKHTYLSQVTPIRPHLSHSSSVVNMISPSSNSHPSHSTRVLDRQIDDLSTDTETNNENYKHSKFIQDLYVDGHTKDLNISRSASNTLSNELNMNVTLRFPVEKDTLMDKDHDSSLSLNSPVKLQVNSDNDSDILSESSTNICLFTRPETKSDNHSGLLNINVSDTDDSNNKENLCEHNNECEEESVHKSNSTLMTSNYYFNFENFSPIDCENLSNKDQSQLINHTPNTETKNSSLSMNSQLQTDPIPQVISLPHNGLVQPLLTSNMNSTKGSTLLFSPILPKRHQSQVYDNLSYKYSYQINQYHYIEQILILLIPQIIETRSLPLSTKLLYYLFKKRLASIYNHSFYSYKYIISSLWTSVIPDTLVIEQEFYLFWTYLHPPFYYSYSSPLFNEDYILRYKEALDIFVTLAEQYTLSLICSLPSEVRIYDMSSTIIETVWRCLTKVINSVLPCIESYPGKDTSTYKSNEIILCLQERKNHKSHITSRTMHIHKFMNWYVDHKISWEGEYKPFLYSLPLLNEFKDNINEILNTKTDLPLVIIRRFINTFISNRYILDLREWSNYEHIIASSIFVDITTSSSEKNVSSLTQQQMKPYPCELPPSRDQLMTLLPYCIGCMTMINSDTSDTSIQSKMNSSNLESDNENNKISFDSNKTSFPLNLLKILNQKKTEDKNQQYCYISDNDPIELYSRPIVRHLSFCLCSKCVTCLYSPFLLSFDPMTSHNIFSYINLSYTLFNTLQKNLMSSCCPLCNCSYCVSSYSSVSIKNKNQDIQQVDSLLFDNTMDTNGIGNLSVIGNDYSLHPDTILKTYHIKRILLSSSQKKTMMNLLNYMDAVLIELNENRPFM